MNAYTEAFMRFPVTPALVYLGMLLHESAQEIIDHYESLSITPSIAAHDVQQALRHQMTPWYYL